MLKTLFATAAISLSSVTTGQATSPMAFDVAEDHTRKFTATTPMNPKGGLDHGNGFISQGYIYPEGTLEAGTSGVLKDGKPAFPDLVIGTWMRDGYVVSEAEIPKTGAWIISREIFSFEAGGKIVIQDAGMVDIGGKTLGAEALRGETLGVETLRPVIRVTGDYAEFEGGLFQTILGFNKHRAVNASFRLASRKSNHAPSFTKTIRPKETIEQSSSEIEWDSGVPVGPYPDS